MLQSNKISAFLTAASEGYVEVFYKLLEQSKGSIFNSLDKSQNNCLHLAAQNGHQAIIEAVQKYIERYNKESLQMDVNALNGQGKTPLDLANEMSKLAIKKLAMASSQPALTSESLREMHIMTQSLKDQVLSLSFFDSEVEQKSTNEEKKLFAFNAEG